VAQTGQAHNGGHIIRRDVEFQHGKWMVGQRWMLGWLDLDKFDFDRPASSPDFLSRFSLRATDKKSATTLIGVWMITTGSGEVWQYFFYKGFRVFYSTGDSPTLLKGGGYWAASGNDVTINWDDADEERMTLSGAAATGSDGTDPWNAKKLSADPLSLAKASNRLVRPF
jgi:hypothetical protein